MSDLTLYDDGNTNDNFNSGAHSGDTVNIVAILNEAESEKGTLLPSEIHISVPLADVNNWEVIYTAVKAYLLAEAGINMDIRDIYGIYSTFKSDDSETTAIIKCTSGFISFRYVDKEGKEVTVKLTLEKSDTYYELELPISIVNDIYNATDIASEEDKVAALLSILANEALDGKITIKAEDSDGNEVALDVNSLTSLLKSGTDIFSAIFQSLDLFPYPVYQFRYTLTVERVEESETGIFDTTDEDADSEGHWVTDPDYVNEGTHEFTYYEQVCLLFAKDQNLITKAGTRYRFPHPSTMFGDIAFDDNYAAAPDSIDRVVICGLEGKTSDGQYDIQEVADYIKEELTDVISTKAYDVVYSDYAELFVEDEMGYYMPEQLGVYDHKARTMTFFNDDYPYKTWAAAKKGVDFGLARATATWGNDKHYSINDAIDALKQERYLIDGDVNVTSAEFDRIFGGYKVKGKDADKDTEIHSDGTIGRPYDDGAGFYGYDVNGEAVKNAISGEVVYSGYGLDEVLTAISTMESYIEGAELRVNNEVMQQSNRAIYVDTANITGSARAFIYLLTNVNKNMLDSDTKGIFEFYDKAGNRVNYQDKVFAGTKYLALVVIGQSGLVFVANRHCKKNTDRIAWMVGNKGYITDKQGEAIVKHGLIHTVSITECDESFDATCTVKSIKIRKVKKNVMQYTPVLYLDTLKVSTIEQASESTDATGGQGNATLMTWDYGKTITLSIEDALFSPASMSAVWGGVHGDPKTGVKDTKYVDRFEKVKAERNFIVPAGNSEGTPVEGEMSAQAVYYDPQTMEPYPDGTPIVEGEIYLKFTRSIAYPGESLGFTVEVSADGFPGVYRVVGETFIRDKVTGEDKRFQFIIPEAKMMTDDVSITLESDGDPVVFDFSMEVLRPEDGVMMKFVQFDTVKNEEENDGSTMVKNTENLNLLDEAELYKIGRVTEDGQIIGATEY